MSTPPEHLNPVTMAAAHRRLVTKALSATSAISIWRETVVAAAACSSPTMYRYWLSGLSFCVATGSCWSAQKFCGSASRVSESL